MNKLKLRAAFPVIFIILLSTIYTKAQAPLTRQYIDSTVIKIGNLMLDNYIIKDKGAEANKMLISNLKKNKYYSLSGDELANVLVEDLQTVANDKHLMIKFYPEGDAAQDYIEQANNQDDDYKPTESSLKRSRFDNYGCKEISILDMNIGYLKLNAFYDIRNPETTKAIAAAMDLLAHTDGIIIDLSDNSGGDAATLQFLLSYFFTADPPTHYNTFHFRDGSDNYIEERTLPYIPGKRLPKTPLYVITSQNTFSAGEAFAYSLKNLGRATIIGQTTGGGAHAADFKLINDYFDMSIPMARSISPITKTNWEGVGVKPTIEMEIEKAKVYAHLALMKNAMVHESNEMLLGKYQWALEELESRLNGVSYDDITLNKYVGNFDGGRRVFIENGQLKYQRGEGAITALVPLNKTSFKLDASTRISFEFEGNTLEALKLYIESGQFNLVKKLN
ncbi:MAG: hypothetical protein GC192_19700 [Bacteroidetes bacterium]|nr:hypothetical protein [Bacteroidota bacterium]